MTTEPEAIPADVLVSIPRDLAERVTEIANRNEQSVEGDKLAVLLSAPRASRAPVDGAGWRPIETAPKPAGGEYRLGQCLEALEGIADQLGDEGDADSKKCIRELVSDIRRVAPPSPSANAQDVGELLAALEWYADPKNWWTKNADGSFGYHNTDMTGSMERLSSTVGSFAEHSNRLLYPDCGTRAKQALAAYKRSTTDGQS